MQNNPLDELKGLLSTDKEYTGKVVRVTSSGSVCASRYGEVTVNRFLSIGSIVKIRNSEFIAVIKNEQLTDYRV